MSALRAPIAIWLRCGARRRASTVKKGDALYTAFLAALRRPIALMLGLFRTMSLRIALTLARTAALAGTTTRSGRCFGIMPGTWTFAVAALMMTTRSMPAAVLARRGGRPVARVLLLACAAIFARKADPDQLFYVA